MLNNKFFYTMSEESLKENYNSFLPQDEELAGEKIEYNEDNFINNAGAKIKEKLT